MKQIIVTFILCVLSAQMTAQKYAVTDTAYTVNTSGIFFAVRDLVYSNGEESHTKTLIGDTTQLFEAFYNRFVSAADQMAADARGVILFPRSIGELTKDNTELLAITGKDALDTITARKADPFLLGGWTIRTGGTPEDISFSVNANGQLRYTITGFTTRNALLFGSVMRLNNYKNGGSIDLYKVESENYKTIDNGITLRRPGGPANKAAAPPPMLDISPAASKSTPPPPVTKPKTKRKTKKVSNVKN